MVKESNKARTWTVPRLQNAVKATFFARGFELGKLEDGIALRYSDLKGAVTASEGPVADRTLSRALADLVGKGHLLREPEGREVFYRLSIPHAEKVGAFAKSDADAIRSAAHVGAVGDLSEGWAYYGIPDRLKTRLRGSLRRAGKAHRKALDDILDRTVDETVQSVLRRGRSKLSREELRKVEKGLYFVLERTALGWLVAVRSQLVWSNIETMIPGALLATQRALGIGSLTLPSSPTAESLAELWSRILRVPPEELRKPFGRELKKLERHQIALDQFFATLSPEARESAGRELNGLIALIANLTAVTRP